MDFRSDPSQVREALFSPPAAVSATAGNAGEEDADGELEEEDGGVRILIES